MSPVMVLGLIVGALVGLMALGIFVSKTKIHLMPGGPISERNPGHLSAVSPTRSATFTSRFRALLIDTAAVSGALFVIPLLGDVGQDIPGFGRIVWVLMFGLLFLYEPLFIWRRGATIGHSAKHLRVVTTGTGEPPGLLRALARYLIKVILGLPSFVTMAFSRQHQAVHDILTQTTVQLSLSADPDVDDYHLERFARSTGS